MWLYYGWQRYRLISVRALLSFEEEVNRGMAQCERVWVDKEQTKPVTREIFIQLKAVAVLTLMWLEGTDFVAVCWQVWALLSPPSTLRFSSLRRRCCPLLTALEWNHMHQLHLHSACSFVIAISDETEAYFTEIQWIMPQLFFGQASSDCLGNLVTLLDFCSGGSSSGIKSKWIPPSLIYSSEQKIISLTLCELIPMKGTLFPAERAACHCSFPGNLAKLLDLGLHTFTMCDTVIKLVVDFCPGLHIDRFEATGSAKPFLVFVWPHGATSCNFCICGAACPFCRWQPWERLPCLMPCKNQCLCIDVSPNC